MASKLLKAIVAVAGVIATIQTGGLINTALGLKTAAGYLTAAAWAGASLLITSVVGRVLAPKNNGANDTGSRIQNPPATQNSLPVVYGPAYLGGTIVDVCPTIDNQTIYYTIAIASRSESATAYTTFDQREFYFGDKLMHFQYDATKQTTFNEAVDYLVDGSGIKKQDIYNNMFVYLYESNNAGTITGLNTTQLPSTVMGASSGLSTALQWAPSGRQMNNTIFAIVKMKYNQAAGTTGLAPLTFRMYHSPTGANSVLPGDVLNDYFTNTKYGCGLPSTLVDSSAITALNLYGTDATKQLSYTASPGVFPLGSTKTVKSGASTNLVAVNGVNTTNNTITYTLAPTGWAIGDLVGRTGLQPWATYTGKITAISGTVVTFDTTTPVWRMATDGDGHTAYDASVGGQKVFRFMPNGVLDTGQTCADNLNHIATSCDSWLTYNNTLGKWSVVINDTFTPVFTLDDTNIIGSVEVQTLNLNATPNVIEVKFPNALNKDQIDYFTSSIPSTIKNANEPLNKLSTSFLLVSDSVRAQYLGTRYLAQGREDLVVNLKAAHNSIQVDVGDVVNIFSVNEGWNSGIYANGKPFRVMRSTEIVEADGTLNCAFELSEYNANVYQIATISEFMPAKNSNLNDPTYFGTLNAPTATIVSSSAAVPSINVLVPIPSTGSVSGIILFISTDGGATWTQKDSQTRNDGSVFSPGSSYTFVQTGIPGNTLQFAYVLSNEFARSGQSTASTSLVWSPSVTSTASAVSLDFFPDLYAVAAPGGSSSVTGLSLPINLQVLNGAALVNLTTQITDALMPNNSWRIGTTSTTSDNWTATGLTVGAVTKGATAASWTMSAVSATSASLTVPVRYKDNAGVVVGVSQIFTVSLVAGGASSRTAYARIANNPSPTTGTVTVSGDNVPSGATVTTAWGSAFNVTWATNDTSPTSNNSLYVCDGIYDGTNTVWTTPYIASLKVGMLSAISANLGTVTAGSYKTGSTGTRVEINTNNDNKVKFFGPVTTLPYLTLGGTGGSLNDAVLDLTTPSTINNPLNVAFSGTGTGLNITTTSSGNAYSAISSSVDNGSGVGTGGRLFYGTTYSLPSGFGAYQIDHLGSFTGTALNETPAYYARLTSTGGSGFKVAGSGNGYSFDASGHAGTGAAGTKAGYGYFKGIDLPSTTTISGSNAYLTLTFGNITATSTITTTSLILGGTTVAVPTITSDAEFSYAIQPSDVLSIFSQAVSTIAPNWVVSATNLSASSLVLKITNTVLGTSSASATINRDATAITTSFTNGTAPSASGSVVSITAPPNDANKFLRSDGVWISPTSSAQAGVYNVKDYGALGNNSADDTSAIQSAINAAAANTFGGTVYFPRGFYRITSSLTYQAATGADPSKRVHFLGDGVNTSGIIQSTAAANGLTIQGDVTTPNPNLYVNITKMSFVNNSGSSTGQGISVNAGAYMKVDHCFFSGWGYGFYGSNMLSSSFDSCFFKFNTRGALFERIAGAYTSSPNALTFTGCEIGANSLYGLYAPGAGVLTMVGGAVESNGSAATAGLSTSWGVRVTDPSGATATESSVGVSLSGVYFENNSGIADLYIDSTSAKSGVSNSVTGCSFSRITSTTYVTNNILVSASSAANGFKTAVVGCGFKGFGTYTVSAARPTISNTNCVIDTLGCNFSSTTDAYRGTTDNILESTVRSSAYKDLNGVTVGSGTITSVTGTGTVAGITLSGTASSGAATVTLGGSLSVSTPTQWTNGAYASNLPTTSVNGQYRIAAGVFTDTVGTFARSWATPGEVRNGLLGMSSTGTITGTPGTGNFLRGDGSWTNALTGDIIAFSTSDKKLKTNIAPISNPWINLSAYRYNRIDADNREEFGFIAQEVQEVLPDLVRENDDGVLTMKYNAIIALLWEQNKELKDRVEKLEARNDHTNN